MVYDKRGTETKPRNDRNYGEHTDRSQQVKKTINGNDLHELLFVRSHLQFLYDHKMITKKQMEDALNNIQQEMNKK